MEINANKTNILDINREKVCPFLLKVFYKENEKNSLDDFNKGNFPAERELHIYTWMDATLREITNLVKEVVSSSKKRDTELYYSIIYYDSKGKLQRKEIGVVSSTKKGSDDLKTLFQLEFRVGDLIDLFISSN